MHEAQPVDECFELHIIGYFFKDLLVLVALQHRLECDQQLVLQAAHHPRLESLLVAVEDQAHLVGENRVAISQKVRNLVRETVLWKKLCVCVCVCVMRKKNLR